MEKVDNMQEQMDNVSKKMETLRKNQQEMPEIINAVIKNEKMPLMGSSLD